MILIFIGLLISFSPISWEHDKFILLGLVPLVFISYSLIRSKEKFSLSKKKILWPLLVLPFYLFIAGFFSVNQSLVFFPLSIIISYFYGWLLVVQFIKTNDIRKLFVYYSYILVLSNLIFLILRTKYDISYADVFSSNYNELSTVILCLSPFVLHYGDSNKRSGFIISLIFIISSIIALFFNGSSGAFFLLIFYCCFHFFNNTFSKSYKFLLLLFLLVIIIITSISTSIILHPGIAHRYNLCYNSILIYLKHPLFGCGIGNGIINLGSSSELSNSFIDSINPNVIHLHRDHNMLTSLIAEFGVVGIGLVGFFFLKFFRLLKGQIVSFHKPFVISIILYFLSSLVYLSNQSYQYHFSEVQFISIICIGCLVKNYSTPTYITNKYIDSVVVILLFTAFSYFFFSRINVSKFHKSLNEKPEIRNRILNEVYHPVLNTIGRSVNESLEQMIAEKAKSDSDNSKASKYYQLSIQHFPSLVYNRMMYGDFLFNQGKINEALAHYTDINSTFEMYYPNKIRLIYSKILENDLRNIIDDLKSLEQKWNLNRLDSEILELNYFFKKYNVPMSDFKNTVLMKFEDHLFENGNLSMKNSRNRTNLRKEVDFFRSKLLLELPINYMDEYLFSKTDLELNQLVFGLKNNCSNIQEYDKNVISGLLMSIIQSSVNNDIKAERFNKAELNDYLTKIFPDCLNHSRRSVLLSRVN